MKTSEKNIKEVLFKFYQGSSTLEEEEFLREYFANQNISEEYSVEREFFSAYEKDSSDDLGIDFDLELTRAISRVENEKVDFKIRFRPVIAYIAAASIAIIFSLGLFLSQMRGDYVFSDTFDDPYLAMQETQRVLGLFSSKIQLAKSELDNLDKIITPIQAMESLNEMNKKLEYLYWIDFLNSPLQFNHTDGIINETEN
jgi:hypothetical protein